MRSVREFRQGKPGFYPDQSIYAEFACAEFGLTFRDLDGGSGLIFSVASTGEIPAFRRRPLLLVSAEQRHRLDARRPTNTSLAKFLKRPACRTIGGEYFFLHDRYRAHRPTGP